jgi:hypothetical protein
MSRAGDDDKGWRRNWAPLSEGVTNWKALLRALQTADFSGTFVFMAFYHDNDEAARTRVLKEEVAYCVRQSPPLKTRKLKHDNRNSHQELHDRADG